MRRGGVLPAIAQRLHEDIAFRVLAANNTPDFRTISDFRKDNLDTLSGLFLQVLALCQQAGLVKLGHVALDGTKVRANASKHKAMSYGRMREKEEQLSAEVEELLRRAEEVDDDEDRRYGQSKRGDELPEELAFREGRLQKIREAMAALEAEAQAAAEQAEAAGKDHSGVPDDKAQRNFTDPESHIMPAPGGRDFVQAYNCQAVVDSAHQVIVAAQATNQPSDKQQAAAMMEDHRQHRGSAQRGIGRRWLLLVKGSRRALCSGRGAVRRHRSRPATAEWRRQRPGVAYPAICLPGTGCDGSFRPSVVGNVTPYGCRRWSRYSARSSRAGACSGGVWRRSGEWSLICTGHNLLKLFRFGVAQPREGTPTNRFAGSIPNSGGVVSTVRRTNPLVRQWLHPATIVVAV